MNAVEWLHVNQAALDMALDDVRQAFYRCLNRPRPVSSGETTVDINASALGRICEVFQLGPLERRVLALCAAVQLDAEFAQLCAELHGDPNNRQPNFDLALRLFNDGCWLPFLSQSSLRYWRLLELADPRQPNLTPLYIDEPVLHYLAGYAATDPALASLLVPVTDSGPLVPSHEALAGRISELFIHQSAGGQNVLVHLFGPDHDAKVAVAQRAAARNTVALRRIDANLLPQDTKSLHELYLRLEREAIFNHCVYLFEVDGIDEHNQGVRRALAYILKRTTAFCLLSGDISVSCPGRDVIKLDIVRPRYEEQESIWRAGLPPPVAERDGGRSLRELLDQFDLDERKIHNVLQQWRATSPLHAGEAGADPYRQLWSLCRRQCRDQIADLARIIEPSAVDWSDLILPDEQKTTLCNIVEQVRQRHKVYRQWGFARNGAYGLGISALFAGTSGTGKTLAARVIASVLQLDIYQIDLSAMVSKYIGETEKNLEKIFQAAERSGAILLFDEADALFGKRSQVNDSKDRYANMEVSYLLQRVEQYSGLSILTTNYRSALDQAFVRRLRFIAQFPFPQKDERARIWRSTLPQQMPMETLDYDKLARLEIPGGIIRSIAINAAFHAAADDKLQMRHIRRAAQEEFVKSEKTLLNELVEDW